MFSPWSFILKLNKVFVLFDDELSLNVLWLNDCEMELLLFDKKGLFELIIVFVFKASLLLLLFTNGLLFWLFML